ncbi:MAG: UDP-glucose 4-epimerase GalE [Oscillospiraceae bacterium]|jgi:UDP-glucose 4-epimerase|nr:UDP-glucose 4-epimerase GalE [Oscillospiraceae bacterium]
MNVLVTGGTGYIGSHTCVALLQAGHTVVILDNLFNSKREAVGRIEALGGKPVRFVQGDMRDSALLGEIFAAQTIDAVIHFAGLKAVGESCAEPLEYYGTNIGGTVTLLEAMRAGGCKTIVFSSSATVYGGQNPSPFREDMPIGQATCPYGSTKIYIEQILRDLSAAEPDWHISLLRYFNPAGAHASGLLGEDPNDIPNNLMPLISEAALGKRSELVIFGSDYDTPDGTCIRDYIHVLDLADGHIKALARAAATQGCETFNLGTGKGLSVLELVHAFEAATGVKIPCRIGPRRPGDIARCYADTTKAEQTLHFVCTRSAEDMCADQWRWLTAGKE